VFHEADSSGSKSGSGSWSGMLTLVISGIAHVGIENFVVTKERSEVVAFIDTLGIGR